ncbi:MAG: small multi-drug export protein [Clostridia bacterium]|nr:small multi-drug export protein [Clostridia bacterium]MDE7329028.1 small multi-drug export protein [Clostridia bacterium]
MTERLIDGIRQILDNDFLTTFLIAIIPIVELRGAIPAAMTMGISPWAAFALAWLGSAIVSPILLLILRPILDKMKKSKAFSSLAHAVESGFKSKAQKVVGESDEKPSAEAAKKLERKKMLGVYLFVAFPIPLTGVWTGSAVATFLDLPFFKSLAMVWLGNLTAGAIVTVLAIFLQNYMSTILDIFFVIVILVLLLYIVRLAVKIVKSKKANKEGGESAVENRLEAVDGDSENAVCVASDNSLQMNKTEDKDNNSDMKKECGESLSEQEQILTAKVAQNEKVTRKEKEE